MTNITITIEHLLFRKKELKNTVETCKIVPLYSLFLTSFFLWLKHSSLLMIIMNTLSVSFTFWLLPKHFSCEVKYVLTAAQHLIQWECLTCAPVMKVVLFLLSLTVCLKSSCVLAKTLEFFIAAVETKWEYVFTDSTDPIANQRWALLLLCTHKNIHALHINIYYTPCMSFIIHILIVFSKHHCVQTVSVLSE